MRITRLGWPLLLFTIAATSSSAPAQSQSQQTAQQPSDSAPKTESPAEAARHSRELKKSQPKPAHVWDNDSIPKQGDGVNVVGSTAPPVSASAAPEASAESVENKTQLDAAIQQAKGKVASLEQDLDFAQRKYTLDSDMYYGKTNYQDDKAGKTALDAEQADVANKKQQLQQARDILASLQGKAGSSSDQKKPTSSAN
ncbi:MAG: hypothetical protein WAK91_14565 [Candidatus Acidiferrales bacterium]|jgi:hypothetical protein